MKRSAFLFSSLVFVACVGDAPVTNVPDASSDAGADGNQPDTSVVPDTGVPDSSPGTSLLTISKVGTGGGSVSSSPTGIDCGATCSAPFTNGAQVTLTAKPTATSTFAGWNGGGCSGTATCVVSVTAPATVTATFNDHVHTTWDPAWSVAGVTYTNGNLSISGNSAGTKNVRTTVGKNAGKYYWEVSATAGGGVTDYGGLGIVESVMPNNVGYIGSAPSGLSFGYATFQTYWLNWSGVTLPAGQPPAISYVKSGIVYMFALDISAGKFWAGQNGTWYNGGDPGTAAAPAAVGLTGTVYPGVTFYASSDLAFTANFGDSAFTHPVPTGFTPGFF